MSDPADETELERLDRTFRGAMARRREGDIEGAEGAFRELLDGYGALGATERLAMTGINLAQLLQQRGALDEAVEMYGRAQDLAASIGDDRRVGLCLGGLATISLERGHHDETERQIEAATAAFRKADDPVGVGNQLGNLGLLRQNQDRLEEAVECFTEAAKHFVTAGYAPGAVGVLQCIGEVHRRQGEFDEAESAHLQALDLAEKTGNAIAEAHSHRALGHVFRLRGDLEAARQHIERGLEQHRAMGDVRGELSALIDLGTVEFANGNGSLAVQVLTECIDRARELGMVTPLTKALLNRALYRLDTERIEAVEGDLDEAGQLLEMISDPMGWNVWSVTRARVHMRRGDWDEADAILVGELARVERSRLAPARPAILGLRASIELLRGNAQRAMALFDESESHYRGLGDVEGARMAVLARLRVVAELGRLETALGAYESLIETVRAAKLKQPVFEAEILSSQADTLNYLGDFEGARARALEARQLYAGAGFQMAQLGAGLLYHQAETDACRLAGWTPSGETIAELTELHQASTRLNAPATEIMAALTLADALDVRGRGEEAFDLVDEALDKARQLAFPNGMARGLQIRARQRDDRGLAIESCRLWRSVSSVIRERRVMQEWGLDEGEVAQAAGTPAPVEQPPTDEK